MSDEALDIGPSNIELEIALLGALLVDNRGFEAVEFLRPEHFVEPAHQRIFAAAERIVAEGGQADARTLRAAFERDGSLIEVGGARYLAEVQGACMDAINVDYYGRSVFELWQRRELVRLLRGGILRAHEAAVDDPPAAIIEEVETGLYGLAERGRTDRAPQPAGDHFDAALRLAEEAAQGGARGVATGIGCLDRLVGGLCPSHLVILAGRPGMGKTQLGFRIAFNAARGGRRVLAFSLEMSGAEIANRELAAELGWDSDALRQGRIAPARWHELIDAAGRLRGLPIYIDDQPALTAAQIRARARRHQRRHGLDLIVIDYLQLMRGSGENRVQEVSGISRDLKALAKELDVPVLAISQLSRAVETRDDKRPVLSDLRESGAIEQDADAVWFAYRHEYYLREPVQREGEDDAKYSGRLADYYAALEQARNVCEVIVAKQRHGPTGSVKLFCDLASARWGDLERRHDGEMDA